MARITESLQSLPGVGPSIEKDLRDLGFRTPRDLSGKDPERMYRRMIALRGEHQDRCLLYVFRCAVYAASTKRPKPRLLKWWNWKTSDQSFTKNTKSRSARSRTKAV